MFPLVLHLVTGASNCNRRHKELSSRCLVLNHCNLSKEPLPPRYELDSANPAERAAPTSLRNGDEEPRNRMRIRRIYLGRDRPRNFAAIVVSPRRPSVVRANSRSMSVLQGGLWRPKGPRCFAILFRLTDIDLGAGRMRSQDGLLIYRQLLY
jgi:hypothetical protein